MKSLPLYISFALSLFFGIGCQEAPIIPKTPPIIPLPKNVKSIQGQFHINKQTVIVYKSIDKEGRKVADYLQQLIARPSAMKLAIQTDVPGQNFIHLKIDQSFNSVTGSYSIISNGLGITISSADPIGLFYGIQTLRQLLPAEIESKIPVNNVDWIVPAVIIEDEPRFKFRSMHLDVGRHFFSVDFVKKYIDLLAFHKMNYFHWHLTEDQGWRIEIKKYPKLAKVASKRNETLIDHGARPPFKFDAQPYGGYYSHEEIKEIVEYAAERFITVIPEIELPAHSLAALAAYPEIGCTGGPYDVATRWGSFEDIFCAGNEQTFQFLEGVLTEVMELFPSRYIHIGGDECPKTRWKSCPKCQKRVKSEGLKSDDELHSYFIKRIQRFLAKNKRTLMGWDEILDGDILPGATVMSWRGETGSIQAAKMGHEVIMTTNTHLYFDQYQTDPQTQPLAIGGYSTLESVYQYEPIPYELSEQEAKYIIGAEGLLWTEYVKTPEYAEYMVFPRACALAEVCWSSKEKRDWQSFRQRLEKHLKRLDYMGVNYFYEVPKPIIKSENIGFVDVTEVSLGYPIEDLEIRYTTDGSEPHLTSNLYVSPITVNASGTIKAISVKKSDATQSKPIVVNFNKLNYLKPLHIEDLESGLKYAYYEGSFKSVREIENNPPIKEGVVNNGFFPEGIQNEKIGLTYSGYLTIEKEGIYHFSLTSDDGSAFLINNELIVNNDGLHTAKTEVGSVALKSGRYPIQLLFFQSTGNSKLELLFEGPNQSKKKLSALNFTN